MADMEKDEVKTTGERIRELRRDLRLSQAELADQLGVGKTTISNYEVDYGLPSAENIKRLAELFDVNIDYLLGETEFKDRFINFIKGRKIPVFDIQNISEIVNNELSKIEGYLELPDCFNLRSGDFFSIRCADNSMDKAKLEKNNHIIIKRGEDVTDGKCGVVVVDDKIVIRRIYQFDNIITLVPDSSDPGYVPAQYKMGDIRILGRVIKALVDIDA